LRCGTSQWRDFQGNRLFLAKLDNFAKNGGHSCCRSKAAAFTWQAADNKSQAANSGGNALRIDFDGFAGKIILS
jgi:hypothetical protein